MFSDTNANAHKDMPARISSIKLRRGACAFRSGLSIHFRKARYGVLSSSYCSGDTVRPIELD